MISINRLPEPPKLKENKEKWLATYLNKRQTNPRHRPPSGQYGHEEIRDILERMSQNKCFYCECKIGRDTRRKSEIDHHMEVAKCPQRAFDWDNLYLSCHDCNRKKLPNKAMPVSECLDICDLSENPVDHLTFESECIRPRANSLKGSNTIKKYKLDRPQLNYARLKWVKNFERFLRKLRERQIQERRQELTPDEREAIHSAKASDHAFSLMFRIYLSDLET